MQSAHLTPILQRMAIQARASFRKPGATAPNAKLVLAPITFDHDMQMAHSFSKAGTLKRTMCV